MTNPTHITALPGQPFVEIVREFDAPASAVFRAHVDPELFAAWTGPRRLTMEVHEFDAAPGGRWRYTSHDSAGGAYGFRGVFHTIEQDALIIGTFEFDGAPHQVSLNTARFEDLGGGRSRYTGHSVFPSLENRDGMVSSGMEYGVTEGFERLDEVLAR